MSKFVSWESEDYTAEWYEEHYGDPDDVYTEYLRPDAPGELMPSRGALATAAELPDTEAAKPQNVREVVANIAARHGVSFAFDEAPVPDITPGDVERTRRANELFPDSDHCCLESGTLGDPSGPHVRWAHYEYLGFGRNCVGPGIRACVLVEGRPLHGEDLACHVGPEKFAPMLEYLVEELKAVLGR